MGDEVVQRDAVEHTAARMTAQSFLDFDSLMESFRPLPVLDDAAGKLIDQINPSIADNIINIASEQMDSLKNQADLSQSVNMGRIVEVFQSEAFFQPVDTRLRQQDVLTVLIEIEMLPEIGRAHV